MSNGLSAGRHKSRWFALSAWLLVLAAFALRLYNLGRQSIWFDEGWTWHLSRMPLGEMALVTAGDRSPPLYYALMHAWMMLAGQSELGLRFVSALADTLTVALVVVLARLVADRLRSDHYPALLAGLIYAVMPFAVWYAQEARMYALVAMLCTASSLALIRWLHSVTPDDVSQRGPSGRVTSGALLATSAILLLVAMYCHYYAIFLLPAQFIIVLAFTVRTACHRRLNWTNLGWTKWPLVQYSIAAASTLVALAPWLVFASGGFAYDDGFHFPLNTIDGRLLEWLHGYASAGLTQALPGWWAPALLIPLALGVLGLAVQRNWRGLLVMLALILGPLLAATFAVRVVYPNRSVFHPRYLIYVAPLTCVLLTGITATRSAAQKMCSTSRWRLLTGVVLIAASASLLVLWLPRTYAYLTDPALQRDDTRGAVQHVTEALAPGDAVIMSRDNFAVRYYWPADKQRFLFAAPEGLHGILHQDASIIAILNRTPVKRVRLMLWQDDVVDPQKFVETSLWPSGFEQGEFNFAQIRLPLYQVDHWPLQAPPFQDLRVTFGEKLNLASFWQRDRGFAGDWFYVVLNWQPAIPLTTDYKVFIHILDDTGKVQWQSDTLPLNMRLPMTRWQAGQTYRDAHAMVIPASVPVGRYHVVAGVYDPAAGRLLVQGGKDHADLGDVEVLQR